MQIILLSAATLCLVALYGVLPGLIAFALAFFGGLAINEAACAIWRHLEERDVRRISCVTMPVLAILVGSASANAADDGFYVKAQLGWSSARDAGIHDSRPTGSTDDVLIGRLDDLGSGASGGIAVGYRAAPWLRVELGASMRGYTLDDHDSGSPTAREKADLRSTALMLNGYVEPFRWGPWTPFAGLGVGFAYNELGRSRSTDSRLPGVSLSGPGGDGIQLAWLATAGIALALTPELRLELAYQYFDAGTLRTDRGVYTDSRGATFSYVGAETKGELRANELLLGLRYSF